MTESKHADLKKIGERARELRKIRSGLKPKTRRKK